MSHSHVFSVLSSSALWLGTLAATPAAQDRSEAATPWQTVRLANGVRLHVVQIPDASTCAVFSFLPVGLDGDPVGAAQFSHLAEHMLIRSTDPKRLQIGQLQLNGETTNQTLRLESIAPSDQWKDAVTRHPKWLTARSFDAATLEREKIRIAGEERGTVPRGYNHKWATAAWSQLVGGSSHAKVHGDVASATVEKLEKYVAERVRLDQAHIFVAGRQAPKFVIAAVKETFAGIPARAKSANAKSPAPEATDEPKKKPAAPAGHRNVTWDLDAAHYLEWYPLPDDTTGAEAEIVSRVLSGACYGEKFFQNVPGRAVAGSVTREGRRYILLSTSLPDGTAIDDVQGAFRRVIGRAPSMAAQARGALFADQFAKLPDFAAQRRQVQNPRFKKLIEANWAMQCGYACNRLGVPIAEVPAAYRKVQPKRIADLIENHFGTKQRHSARVTFQK